MTKIAKAAGRDVKEWFGKSPNSMPPQSVRLRIFDRAAGICFLSGFKIKPTDKWHLHHCDDKGLGIEEGCENREKWLHPALVDPHKKETAVQRKRKAKSDSVRIKHIGAKLPSARPIQSRGFQPTGKPKLEKLPLPSRRPGYFGCFKIEE